MADYASAAALLAMLGVSSAMAAYNNRQNIKNNNARFSDQTDLANTAHQREVMDLRAAGLNPILSAGGSGASVPSTGAATADNPAESFGSSAQKMAELASQQYEADVEATRNSAEVDKLDALTRAAKLPALEKQVEAQSARAEYDATVARDELSALQDLRTADYSVGKNGALRIIRPEYRELLKSGIESDLKIRSNRNWRGNLKSISGAITGAADDVNSGLDAARKIKRFPRR